MATKTPVGTVLKRFLILLLAIAIGVAIVVGFVSKKQPPARIETTEQSRPVRVIETVALPLVITATGFGTARPEHSWSAISSVKGNVIYRHSDLESGALVDAGTLLLETDPGLYRLALAEAEADLASVDAQIAQLHQEAENAGILLEIERQRLDLAEADLERTRELVTAGAMPQSALDTQLRATLLQRKAVQTLVNQQGIVPIQLRQLEAQKERVQSKRAIAESNLADTKFHAPFDLRISEVKIEEHQYVNPGQMLFSGDGIDTAEVILQVPMHSLRRVIAQLPDSDTINVGALDAQVQMVGEAQTWPASVTRIANGIDPATRTVRVVLRVQQPTGIPDPVNNPPLPKGMYVAGHLGTPASAPRLILPQAALHEGVVYVVDAQNRLERRTVTVAFRQDGMAVIDTGLRIGETVILDDIVPAITGMLLAPERDMETEAALETRAAGGLK